MTLAVRRHPQIFEKSRLKDSYRSILDQAKSDGAVIVRDSPDQDLFIVRGDVWGAYESSYEHASQFAQFVAAVNAMIQTRASRTTALNLGRLSWAADLSPVSFREFADAYAVAFLRAVNTNDWRPVDQLLIVWSDTAAIERDHELMARVLDEGTAKEHTTLERPVGAGQ